MHLVLKIVVGLIAFNVALSALYYVAKAMKSAKPTTLTAAQQANVAAVTAGITASQSAASAAGAASQATPAAAARSYTPLTSLDTAKNTISTTNVPAGVAACNTLCDNTPGCVATSYSSRAQSCALKAQVAAASFDADKTLSVLATDLPTTFPNTVANGTTVPFGQVLVSPGGKAAMLIGPDNALTVYSLATGKAVMSAGTGGKGTPPAYLSMQNDNNFVLYDSANKALWATGTYGQGTPGSYSFALNDTGFTVGVGHGLGQLQPKYSASWTL